MNRFNKTLAASAVVIPAAMFANLAHAQAVGPDYTTLTSGITFDSTAEAVMAVGVLAIGLTVTVLGVRKVLQMIRGA